MTQPLRLLMLGAHPDDSEFHAGGLATRYCRLGHVVKMVSVTDGGAGHHQLSGQRLVETRRREAQNAADVIGAISEVWPFPDGRLTPSLDVRERVIREMRQFRPDLVLTHRTCDYHPDHRAVGQVVQDASYLVTVPLIVPDVEHLPGAPVVAFMPDAFSKPYPMQADVVLDIAPELEAVLSMIACHASQVFEWLPYNQGLIEDLPVDENERLQWLRHWYLHRLALRAQQWSSELERTLGAGDQHRIEAFEISEYAGHADEQRLCELFPGGVLTKQPEHSPAASRGEGLR